MPTLLLARESRPRQRMHASDMVAGALSGKAMEHDRVSGMVAGALLGNAMELLAGLLHAASPDACLSMVTRAGLGRSMHCVLGLSRGRAD